MTFNLKSPGLISAAKTFAIGILSSAILWALFLFIKAAHEHNKEKTYCGKVVRTYLTPSSDKRSSEAHVIFYSPELKRNIDVRVTWNTYANSEIDSNTCFGLSERDLER